MKEKREVFPGDEVAVEEEYLASDGTFASDGKIYASQIGVLELDEEEMIARVISPNPPNILRERDVVFAIIADTRSTMATADVVAVDGKLRDLGGETYATIHVSKISPGYTDDVSKELRKGDYIRAEVIGTKPSLQLTTKAEHYGVVRALCFKCKSEMARKGKTQLYCGKCERSVPRKLADDYGNVVF
ncbi:MAG: exosome complex RNA-binding protein Csl4 [Methanomassiliicoccaceae archaeon]|jgi:exosome complex component CSL4|nr:exosome complex RNA-binding protein Csl4 [Methanomassiliicoccaceae archaeon]